jgi:hypothetical protein
MDMIWISVASLLYPETDSSKTVARDQIEMQIQRLYNESVTRIMIEKHLAGSEDRQADKSNLSRGGSRNRYLFKTSDGRRFRLYRASDSKNDGWDKIGPTHPDRSRISDEYHYLLDWYVNEYSVVEKRA